MTSAPNPLEEILAGPVRGKRNRTRDLLARAKRVSRRAPEVMVKITGFSSGAKPLLAHLRYITRHGRVEAETAQGEHMTELGPMRELAEEWAENWSVAERHPNQRDACKLLLSMPPETPPDAVLGACRRFTERAFGEHDYLYVLHTDREHPHCHVVVKMCGNDGVRLNPRKKDLFAWRELFAHALREQGIDAEATPRRARGVVLKASRPAIWHMEHPRPGHAVRVPKIRALQVQEATQALTGTKAENDRPWESAIAKSQSETREGWLEIAAHLDRSSAPVSLLPEMHDARQFQSRLRSRRRPEPHPEPNRPHGSPFPLTSLRELPGLDVVPVRDAAEVLLQQNARHRVGRSPAAGDALRRTPDQLTHRVPTGLPAPLSGTLASDRKLAAQIRHFVKSMPAIETAREATQRRLIALFTRPQTKQAVPPRRDHDRGHDLER